MAPSRLTPERPSLIREALKGYERLALAALKVAEKDLHRLAVQRMQEKNLVYAVAANKDAAVAAKEIAAYAVAVKEVTAERTGLADYARQSREHYQRAGQALGKKLTTDQRSKLRHLAGRPRVESREVKEYILGWRQDLTIRQVRRLRGRSEVITR